MECLMPHKEFCSKQRLVTIFQIDFARHTMLNKLIFAKKKSLGRKSVISDVLIFQWFFRLKFMSFWKNMGFWKR